MAPQGLDIIIPMAGRGSRFANVGYKLPKPLIDVAGRPMIARVIENLRPQVPHRFIFLVLDEHLKKFDLASQLKSWAGPQTICVTVDQLTEGAACTVLLAQEYLSSGNDLMIANSDQLIEDNISDYVNFSRVGDLSGTIMVFEDNDPKWSFARLNEKGNVVEVAEKKLISNLATVGIYYFRKGNDFIAAAKEMVRKDIRVNNEFYVCPVYNEMINLNQRITTWKIEKQTMHGIGTPEDLKIYVGLRKC